ncbi:phospholipase [Alcanivorax hongdengensis A-11-3]|uniref:Phospholipase n=1 Tax=Alcanivorax hongdengensis A-11-3 TaxID=1177179 RepID=L0WA53_9GAMM|nr:MBL fold metallo-hydrolase [Alcanivorax hongdengensis]EKF72947.1 phospholipase [Alcanivorax hongdengensis A-11-3]
MIDRERLAALASEANHDGKRYQNRYRTPHHGLREFVRWQWQSRGQFPAQQSFPLITPAPHMLAEPASQPRLTWIGHSTFLLQYRGWNLLTDPVFSERCSPVQFAGPKRAVPPALSIDELPPINAILVSHNHYDHLDRRSVRQLQARFGRKIVWFVPQGVADWLRRFGVERIIELGWWQSEFHGQVEAFCLPAQHFSGRGAGDHNRSLWCSWRLQFPEFSFYFAGDTGYAPVFSEISELLGPVDLALLPIGAYEPRWFMSPVHVNPAEAVRIHCDLQAKESVAMHWGTFILTDEPMDAPPKALATALKDQDVDARRFHVPRHGETLMFESTKNEESEL